LSISSLIDLRTDVLTPPTEEMWEAMRQAELGWTLYRQDRAVIELEERGAELLGKQAALFLPTCSMASLLALMTLGERGTQAVVEASAHIITSEEWGITSIAGLFPRLITGVAGALDPVQVEAAIVGAPSSPTHTSRTSLVCLENSHNNAGGVALSAAQTNAVAAIAQEHDARVYLDGARLFNSAAALGVSAKLLVEHVDAVGVSLNKGLSAPFGALLCGTHALIDKARINVKRIGAGSIHKAGIFAAAALVALDTMPARLADDNRRASALARGLVRLDGIEIDLKTVQTNIVYADVARLDLTPVEFANRLEQHGVLVYPRPGSRVRFVTHRMIGDTEIERAVNAVASAISRQSSVVSSR
jgi:threonine aldolase